jgi:Tfp pilus assembly protein PilN
MRLFYMRQTSWERWLEAVGGIRLDALLPPQVALDPILGDRDVVLPVAGGGRFLLRPNGTGGRTGVPVTTVPDGAFGAGETPLAWDRLGLGPLAALSADEQAQYAPTLLLAAYGLSPEMGKSPEGALPIPYNQRPRRNQMNQFLAVALVLLTVTLGALAVWREYAARATCLAELRAERDRIDQQIAQMSATVTPIAGAEAEEDPLTVLERELRTARAEMDRPSLPMLLVELTQTVGRDAWCKSFKWDDGRVVVELDESEQDSELVRNLEASPVIGDVLVQSGRPLAGRYQETIKMNARWDTGGEEDLAVPVVPPVPGSPDGSQPPGSDEQDPTAVVPRKAPPGVPPNLLKPRKER